MGLSTVFAKFVAKFVLLCTFCRRVSLFAILCYDREVPGGALPCPQRGVVLMSEAEVSQFLCVLIKMGEALQNSGAEVFRVEDTLNRIAAAYGAEEVNIFVITSSIVVTLDRKSVV